MRQASYSIALFGVLLVAPVMADQVHLANGRVFEDVVAEVGEDSVRIHLAFGEMSLPRHMVARVVQAESSLERFQVRRDALMADPASTAAEWLELARWALDRGVRHAAREAALQAAARDPSVPGLAALMQSLEYVLDPSSGRWLPYEESQRRKGYALVEGRWLSPEQQIAWARAEAEAVRERRRAEEQDLTRAVLALAAASLTQHAETPTVEIVYPLSYAAGPFLVGPVRRFPHRPGVRDDGPSHPGPRRREPAAIPLERRQPGSLFPIAPSPHHGGVQRPGRESDAPSGSAGGG